MTERRGARKGIVFLVGWPPDEAQRRAEERQAAGWEVEIIARPGTAAAEKRDGAVSSGTDLRSPDPEQT